MYQKNYDNVEKNFAFDVLNGKAYLTQCFDSFPVGACFGTIKSSKDADSLMGTHLRIEFNRRKQVKVTDMSNEEQIMYWDSKTVFNEGSSILLYLLTEKAETLIYKSPEPKTSICIATPPKRHPADEKRIVKLCFLQRFNEYSIIKDLMRKDDKQESYGFAYYDISLFQ